MAFIYVSEYSKVARDEAGNVIQAGTEPRNALQRVAIGGGSVQSSAFSTATTFIRVHTDATCAVEIGPNPTAAAASSARMAANTTEFFGVKGGDKIAVITNT